MLVQCVTPLSSVQRYRSVRALPDAGVCRSSGRAGGSARASCGAGGSMSGGAAGGGGGFGTQTQVYGLASPSPRSSYRPVGYSTTEGIEGGGAGATGNGGAYASEPEASMPGES